MALSDLCAMMSMARWGQEDLYWEGASLGSKELTLYCTQQKLLHFLMQVCAAFERLALLPPPPPLPAVLP